MVTDDSVNPNDSNGVFTYNTASDWLNFENVFRAIGNDGSAFPNANNDADCNSGSCRIWDYSLSRTDSNVLDMYGRFVDQANCPSSVDGNMVITDRQRHSQRGLELRKFQYVHVVHRICSGLR